MRTSSPGWMPTEFLTTSPGWSPDPALQGYAVRLGDLELRTEPTPLVGRPLYFLNDVTALDGWLTPARDVSTVIDHPSGDGQILGEQRLEARNMSLPLIVIAHPSGPYSLFAALDALSAVRRDVLVVSERDRGLTRECDVRVTQMVPVRRSPQIALVVLTLAARDPLRYSSQRVQLSNGSNTMINRGDHEARPLIELVGPHSALTIQHPGGTRTLPALAAGVQRTIDCRNGKVYDGAGSLLHGAARGSGPWPRIPAGGTSWTISGLGSGAARARRTEAWT